MYIHVRVNIHVYTCTCIRRAYYFVKESTRKIQSSPLQNIYSLGHCFVVMNMLLLSLSSPFTAQLQDRHRQSQALQVLPVSGT